MRRAPSQVHAATGDFDEEQHVQTLEPDGIDGKEINRDRVRRLGAKELAPRGATPRPRRPERFLAQDLLHRGRRHDDAETFQLANDTLIPPARVFPCQPNDQLSNLTVNARSTGSSFVGPAFRHETSVPTQKRRRRDQQRRPRDPRQHPRGRRQNHRSADRKLGRPTSRRRTASSWRSTTISSSLNSVDRNSRNTTCRTRWNAM
jgi:hypothetical protein